MTQTASFEQRPTHPLAGLETWPKSGPIYGIDIGETPSTPNLMQRISEFFGKSPNSGDGDQHGRIWY
ncbi:MAG: hypothetical protein KL863_14845 [Rhizobium sp.]|nr:hypothetical protein [Rhizobium sp.]